MNSTRKILRVLSVALGIGAIITPAVPAAAQSLLFPGIQAAAKKVARTDPGIAKFYAERNFKPVFVGNKGKSRRNALIAALQSSGAHGLPTSAYDPAGLQKQFRSARSPEDRGAIEIKAAKLLVRYANDISTGIIDPSRVDPEIAISPKRLGAHNVLDAYAKSNPKSFLNSLAPKGAEYAALLKEKQRLEKNMRGATVADVPAGTLRPGTKSKNVAMMRAKLSALGYGKLGNSPVYDSELVEVVKKFQKDKGLGADGVAGPATIATMNFGPKNQLVKVLVNLERQRWMNFERGARHVSVNIPDYSVTLVDNGKTSFKSRTVVGQTKKDFRTPEFFDSMTHMVVNPTWNVPKSIAVKEYVPIMRRDAGFLKKRGMYMVNGSGKPVNPASVDLASYNENNFKTFPYFIKQRPDPRNALGRVKFMFPNKYNIYLHDTPSKSLFTKDRRTFSHGCVRVHKPFDFAHKLLERQLKNPQGTFKAWLDTKKEKFINLKEPLPVYITYRTVYFDGASTPTYRADVYGRDKKVMNALTKAGVVLRAKRS